MKRDVGKFLEMAKAQTRLVNSVWEIKQPRIDCTVCLRKLTDPELLERPFPPQLEGTPYSFFSQTDNPQAQAWIIVLPGQEDQAHYEAALGMMDNPYFR